MDPWTALLVGSNALYWGVFVYLLSRRRWSWSGLCVGLLHMIISAPLVLGPWRALFGDAGFHYQVGYLEGSGLWAFFPASVLLMWALGSAWLAVALAGGRWMLVGAIGDALMALNIAGGLVANRAALAAERIQGGEYFTITGGALVAAILLMFAMPLVACSVWSFRRVRNRSTTSPRGDSATRQLSDEDPGSGRPMLRQAAVT